MVYIVLAPFLPSSLPPPSLAPSPPSQEKLCSLLGSNKGTLLEVRAKAKM